MGSNTEPDKHGRPFDISKARFANCCTGGAPSEGPWSHSIEQGGPVLQHRHRSSKGRMNLLTKSPARFPICLEQTFPFSRPMSGVRVPIGGLCTTINNRPVPTIHSGERCPCAVAREAVLNENIAQHFPCFVSIPPEVDDVLYDTDCGSFPVVLQSRSSGRYQISSIHFICSAPKLGFPNDGSTPPTQRGVPSVSAQLPPPSDATWPTAWKANIGSDWDLQSAARESKTRSNETSVQPRLAPH